ncbi:hypothetical protein E6C27_scaffold848G00930 [Cucumis melo var. makuwa]|uniref:Uncharacterized protein n=1 Tax=Cucumis melo var. makuwa TaxID=1194695 RepID=A0A5A7SNL6_CUCMM|nr:hypothetical protein E6C27_scaffold848G00930 [Cucumis melo var. makuwa]
MLKFYLELRGVTPSTRNPCRVHPCSRIAPACEPHARSFCTEPSRASLLPQAQAEPVSTPPVEPPSLVWLFSTQFLDHLGRFDLERWISSVGAQALQPRPRVLPRDTEDQIFVPTGVHVARVRERARDWVEAEVGAKASWRATRSDRGEP